MVDVDRSSIAAVVAAMYRNISFRPGERPDWSIERTLFAPGAVLVRHTELGREVFDLEGYIRNVDGRLPSFHEREICAITHEFGDIGQSFSTYEARATEDSAEILFRGINSIQLLRTHGQWQIVSLVWQRETPSMRIPERYLGGLVNSSSKM